MLNAIAMRRALAIVFASALLGSIGVSAAPAPIPDDSEPPMSLEERAGICDAFDGLAFTFCVALCEARACDLLDTDDARCALLRDGFATASDGVAPPCPDTAPAPASLRAS